MNRRDFEGSDAAMTAMIGRRAMRLSAFAGLALSALVVTLLAPAPAAARGGVGISVYGSYHAYPPYYYRPRYYYYPPPYYYYPPPPPPVVYVPVPQPPPPQAAPAATPAVPPASQTNCKDYQSTITIDGRPQRVTGTACLQADGTWRIIR